MEVTEGGQPSPPAPDAPQMVRPPLVAQRCTPVGIITHQATPMPPKDAPSPPPQPAKPLDPPTFSAALQFAKSEQVLKHPFAARTSQPEEPAPLQLPSLPAIKPTMTPGPTTGLRLEDSARSMEGLHAGAPLSAKAMPSQPSGGLYSPASGSQPNPLSNYLAAAAAAGYDIPEAVLRATRGGSLTDSDVGSLLYVVVH